MASYNDPFLKELEEISDSEDNDQLSLQDNSEELDY